MIYLFLGPPASGKGTQAHLLSLALGIPTISIGARMREISQKDPSLAAKINQGEIIIDTLYMQLIGEIAEAYADTIILDGALRHPDQIDTLIKYWDASRMVVLWIDIPDAMARTRALRRVEMGSLKRLDDSDEVVAHRLELYRQTTDQIKRKLLEVGIPIIHIDGSRTIDQVHQTIMQRIKSL